MTPPDGWIPKRGEIIFINQTPHAGKEIGNWHPLLVCSSEAFNQKVGIVIGFPMTHADFHKDNPFAVTTKGGGGEDSYVLAFQPKSFDWRERRAKPHALGTGHEDLLKEAFGKLDLICGITHQLSVSTA